MNMFDSSDDYDFTPSSSSRLTSLFDDSPTTVGNANNSKSLIYTAPKQPRIRKDVEIDESTRNTPQNNSAVVTAKAVNLWKVEKDNKKTSLGRHGLAIIGSISQNIFELIIYKEKNNILFRAKLSEHFTWNIYPDNFGAFQNEHSQCFMIKFDNKDDQNTFIEHLNIYNCTIIDTTKIQVNKSEKIESNDKNEDSDSCSESTNRANILERIKNMGQQLLPRDAVKNATSTDLSDSEVDDGQNKKVPPRKMKRNVQKSLESDISSSTNDISGNNISTNSNQLVTTSFVSSSPVAMYQPQQQFDLSSFLMMQNAELKANIMHISNKIDNIKMGTNSSSNDEKSLHSKLKAIELKLENTTKDFERTKRNYNDLQKKYDSIKSKGNEEQNVIIEKDRVISLQKNEIDEYKKQNENNKNVIERLEKELQKSKCEINEKNDEILKLKEIEDLSPKIEELNSKVRLLEDTVKRKEEVINEMQIKETNEVKKFKENLAVFENTIKNNMNEFYQSFMSQFMDKDAYSADEIQANVAKFLKSATFKIIENSKDILN